MNAPFAEMRRLHDRGPNARGLVVDADCVMLGPDCVLAARNKTGYRRIDAGALDRLLKTTFGAGRRLERFSIVLDHITDALAAGDIVKAQLLGLEIPLGALDDEQLIRLHTASSLIKAGFDPDQARDERGRWTAEGDADTGAGVSSAEADRGSRDGRGIAPVAGKIGHTPAEKERFVEAHLADARKIAEQLHVPVENILALSALESGWGDGPFAKPGNNFFSLHSKAPFENGSRPAERNPKVRVATFASYADSARSFAERYGDLVNGKADPREFAAALMRTLPRLTFCIAAAIAVATILSDFALADTKKIPFKIDEPTENRLAAEGADHGATEEDFEYSENISKEPIPFFSYQGLSRPPADGSFGYFAVNPWTGDVWALWGCRRLSTPTLRKSQAEIRKRFTSDELKQYAKLRRIRPDCIYDAHEGR